MVAQQFEQEEWERPEAGRQSAVIVSGSSSALESHHHHPQENWESAEHNPEPDDSWGRTRTTHV